jgi:hypothetical protein
MMRIRGDKLMAPLTLRAHRAAAPAATVDKYAGLRQLTPARPAFWLPAPRFT